MGDDSLQPCPLWGPLVGSDNITWELVREVKSGPSLNLQTQKLEGWGW